MSVTTFGDLLSEAEATVCAFAAQRKPEPGPLLAAWPAFCRSGMHAIRATTGDRDPRWYAVDMLGLEAARASAAVRPLIDRTDPETEPSLVRAGTVLAAAGDLLAGADRRSPTSPLLDDDQVRAAQARIAAVIAAAAHSLGRSLPRTDSASPSPRDARRTAVGHLRRLEHLATEVLHFSSTTCSRVDDIAVLSTRPGALTLEDAVELWTRQARDTIHAVSPSARDLQAVAADLSRISSHSRVLVTAAAEQGIIAASQRAPICQALTWSALAWVRVAEAWTGRHTTSPATASKIATSHALGRALMDITRDGNSWATPQTVAARVDLHRALGSVRRAHDVGTEAAEHQPQVLQALVHSGVLFVPARSVSTTVERLKTRGRGGMTTAGDGEVAALMDSMTSQIQHSRQATQALHSPRRNGASSTDVQRLREWNGPIR